MLRDLHSHKLPHFLLSDHNRVRHPKLWQGLKQFAFVVEQVVSCAAWKPGNRRYRRLVNCLGQTQLTLIHNAFLINLKTCRQFTAKKSLHLSPLKHLCFRASSKKTFDPFWSSLRLSFWYSPFSQSRGLLPNTPLLTGIQTLAFRVWCSAMELSIFVVLQWRT